MATNGANGKTLAAIYTRVSTLDQGRGASLETQTTDCRRYCESNGLLVVAEFQDTLSGMRADRLQYQEMLRRAEAGDFQVIVCWKMDRFGRDRLESGFQIRELQRVGVRVDSATEPNDSPLLRNILMDFAEEESRRTSQRVSANKRTRAQQGRWTGPAPFGYRAVPHPEGGRVLEPDKDAPLVAELFEMYLSGHYTLANLRDHLEKHSASSRRPTRRSSVHKLLQNPIYAGIVRYGRQFQSKVQVLSPMERKERVFEAAGQHQAIVDLETYRKVQARLENNRLERTGRPRTAHLFVGLTWCWCGSRYSAHRTTGDGVSYYCSRRTDSGKCDNPSVTERRLRAAVLAPIEALLETLHQEDIQQATREKLQKQANDTRNEDRAAQVGLEKKLDQLKRRLSRYEEMYADAEMSRDRYLDQRGTLEPQIQALEVQLTERPRLALPDIEQFFAMADALEGQPPDNEEWREIVGGMVDRIIISGHDIRVEWKEAFAGLLETANGS